jgi:hypothetical protein
MKRGPGAPWLCALLATAGLSAQAPTPVFTTNDEAAPAAAKASSSRKDAVHALLEASGTVGDVPLAAAAFASPPPASGPCRVLVALEVGRRQILPDSLAIGLRVFDARGSVAFNGIDEARVSPVLPDVASPLQYVATIPLPAGEYRLRAAVVDAAGRQAALDHRFVVPARSDSEPLATGGAMIGIGEPGTGSLRPLVRAELARPGAVAWVEIAGSGALSGTVSVNDAAGAAMATGPLTVDKPAADGTRLAHGEIPVRMLPPGRYVAALTLALGGRTIVRARPFTLGVLPPPENSELGALVTTSVGAFRPADVLAPDVLGPVLQRAVDTDATGADETMRTAIATVTSKGVKAVNVTPFAKRTDLGAWMLRGAVLLDQGRLEDAATAFRSALRVSSEFLPAITYLGACYAAGGRDREAVGAWQTALVTETDAPLVYRLAADGLLRLGDSAEAVTLLAEAAERWPEETALLRRHTLAVAAREGPAHAVDALLPALERAEQADADLVSLAAQLAIASAARSDDRAAERVRRVAAVAGQSGTVPPLLARWNEYLRAQ